MKILITGIGIVGKSTLRRKLVDFLRKLGLRVEHMDVDNFQELRNEKDTDCLKAMPETFPDNVFYIIEDVRGPLPTAALPLQTYDLIVYVKAGLLSHLLFWLSRGLVWLSKGHFDWDRDKGWSGTGKPYDWRNILPILKRVYNNLSQAPKWVKEDQVAIAEAGRPCVVVGSGWTKNGPTYHIKNRF